jgi:regulator of replication initiation timing
MEDPKVIYLGPACQKEGDGREWCEDDVWPQCECGCSSIRYVLESDAQSELAALREELTDLGEELQLTAEERDHAKRNSSAFEDRMGDLQVENGKLRDRLNLNESAGEHVESHLEQQADILRIERDALNQRLAAAEQRNAEMVELLRGLANAGDWYTSALEFNIGESGYEWFGKIESVLKPTESGASA